MEQQTIIDSLQAEIETENDFFQVADLNLNDEQLDSLKGGPMFCTWCTTIGNHNETTVSDDDSVVSDLAVSDEQASEVTGGVRVGKLLGVGY